MIIKAEKKHLSQIAELEKRYIDVAWTANQLEESYESGNYDFFVEIRNDTVAAYGFIQWCADEGNICNIATKEEYRHNGFAFDILTIMEETAKSRKVSKLYLEVSEDNVAAVNLYEKKGYTRLYRRAKYYGEKAAIVMSKII